MVRKTLYKTKQIVFIVLCLVDIIVVLDSEWLATKLTSDLPSVKLISLPKSGGVCTTQRK